MNCHHRFRGARTVLLNKSNRNANLDQPLREFVNWFSTDNYSDLKRDNANLLEVFVETCRLIDDKAQLFELINQALGSDSDQTRMIGVTACAELGVSNEVIERTLRSIAAESPKTISVDLRLSLAMVGVSASETGLGADPGSLIPRAIEGLVAIGANQDETHNLLLRLADEEFATYRWRERQIAAIKAIAALIPDDPRTTSTLRRVANNERYRHVYDCRNAASQALVKLNR